MAIIIKEASKAPLAISGLANDMARIYLSYNQQKLDQADREQQMIWRREDKQIDEKYRRDVLAQQEAEAEKERKQRERHFMLGHDQSGEHFGLTHGLAVKNSNQNYSLGLGDLQVKRETLGLNREQFQDQSERAWAGIEQNASQHEDKMGIERDRLSFLEGQDEQNQTRADKALELDREKAYSAIELNEANIKKINDTNRYLQSSEEAKKRAEQAILKMDPSMFKGGEADRETAAAQAAQGDFTGWQNLLVEPDTTKEPAHIFHFRNSYQFWKSVGDDHETAMLKAKADSLKWNTNGMYSVLAGGTDQIQDLIKNRPEGAYEGSSSGVASSGLGQVATDAIPTNGGDGKAAMGEADSGGADNPGVAKVVIGTGPDGNEAAVSESMIQSVMQQLGTNDRRVAIAAIKEKLGIE